jgi:hypothetical protein
MKKVLIKVSTPSGTNFNIMNESAISEVRDFCNKVGYEYKLIGIRKNDK